MKILNRIINMIKYGVITRVSTDTADLQLTQGSQNGRVSDMHLINPYSVSLAPAIVTLTPVARK